eukprot:scaffold2749_cov128-Skeletonema_marinoi.AAC.5
MISIATDLKAISLHLRHSTDDTTLILILSEELSSLSSKLMEEAAFVEEHRHRSSDPIVSEDELEQETLDSTSQSMDRLLPMLNGDVFRDLDESCLRETEKMAMASVDASSLQERLRAAKQEVALARRNEEAAREQIRSIGLYEEDSLLALCDGGGSPLLTHAISFLDERDVGRCAMVCQDLHYAAVKCWENMLKMILIDLDSMMDTTITSKDKVDVDVGRLTTALSQLNNVFAQKQGAVPHTILTTQVKNDYDKVVMKVARVLNYVNRYQSKSALPSSLTEETTAALTHLVRMNCCRSMISQSTVEILIHETVSALLNPSLICVPGMMVSMNKLAMRVVLSPSPIMSQMALINMQLALISSFPDITSTTKDAYYDAKFSRVLKKLSQKHEGLDGLGLGDLFKLLYSIDRLIETVENLLSQEGASDEIDEILRPSKAMSKKLVLELVRCKGVAVREVVEVESRNIKCIEPILIECEKILEMERRER